MIVSYNRITLRLQRPLVEVIFRSGAGYNKAFETYFNHKYMSRYWSAPKSERQIRAWNTLRIKLFAWRTHRKLWKLWLISWINSGSRKGLPHRRDQAITWTDSDSLLRTDRGENVFKQMNLNIFVCKNVGIENGRERVNHHDILSVYIQTS